MASRFPFFAARTFTSTIVVALLSGNASAQYAAPRPQVVAKAPGPVSTIFGVPVGARLSAEPLVPCANAEAVLARRACDAGAAAPPTGAASATRVDIDAATLATRGWRLVSVKLDDATAGTALLVGALGRSLPLDVVLDRDDTVQAVSIPTPASEHDRLLAMLSAKYGKPMRTEPTATTPNYFWDFANVRIGYRSDIAPATDASPMATGRIRLALPGVPLDP